jgi:hypothetical protein
MQKGRLTYGKIKIHWLSAKKSASDTGWWKGVPPLWITCTSFGMEALRAKYFNDSPSGPMSGMFSLYAFCSMGDGGSGLVIGTYPKSVVKLRTIEWLI